MSSNIKNETKKGVLWGFIDRFSLQFIQFVIGVILARLLAPSDYGLIGMLSIFMAISQTLIDSGFSNALIQRKNRTEVDLSTVFYFNVAIGFLLYISAFVIAPFVADFFNEPILSPLFRVISLSLLLNSLVVVQRAITTINIDFKGQAYINVISSVTSGIIGIVLAFLGYGVWALAIQSVSHTALSCLLFWYYTRWIPMPAFSVSSFKSLFSYGSKILASGLLHTFYVQLTSILLGKFYSSSILGFYSRAEHLATLPLHNITMVLQKTTFPIMSKIQDDDKRLIYIYGKYLRASSMVIFFIIFLLVAIADPLVRFLLGTKWESSIIPFQLLCFAFMFDHLFSVNLNLLQVKGRSDLFLYLEIVKKIISITLIIVGLKWGIIGLCVSKIIYSQIALIINTYYTGKLFHYNYLKQVRDFLPYLLMAFFANLPSYFIQQDISDNYLLILILCTIVSLLLYIAELYLIKDELFSIGWSFIIKKCRIYDK